MNAWHLIWIIPAAAAFGFFWAALLAVGKQHDVEQNVPPMRDTAE